MLYLATDGTNWFELQTSGGTWQTKTGTYTALAGDQLFVNTASSAFTITLPASPTVGDEVRFLDLANTFDTNNLTVGRNSEKIDGTSSRLNSCYRGCRF